MRDTASQGSPRRNPLTGGYPRGAETRARIIAAALKVFGDEGYERASTREIAKEAGVNPPALQYYFDSKEGLHRACAEFIVDSASRLLDQALRAGRAVSSGPADQDRALLALCDLMDALLDASLFSKDTPGWARFSARAQTDETSPARTLIQQDLVQPVYDLCTRLVALAIGSDVDDQVRLRASAVLSQITAFTVNRTNTLRALDWPDFDGPRRDMVKAVIRAHTQKALRDS